MIEFGIGDEIEIVDVDAPEDVRRATVTRFMRDEEQGNPVSASCVFQMMPPEAELDTMRIGDIELDPATRTIKKSGHRVHLTPKEFELVQLLMSHAGRPIRHSRLLVAVWGPGYGLKPEYLRTYVCQLRKKLEDDPEHPQYLLTHSHFGYCFADR